MKRIVAAANAKNAPSTAPSAELISKKVANGTAYKITPPSRAAPAVAREPAFPAKHARRWRRASQQSSPAAFSSASSQKSPGTSPQANTESASATPPGQIPLSAARRMPAGHIAESSHPEPADHSYPPRCVCRFLLASSWQYRRGRNKLRPRDSTSQPPDRTRCTCTSAWSRVGACDRSGPRAAALRPAAPPPAARKAAQLKVEATCFVSSSVALLNSSMRFPSSLFDFPFSNSKLVVAFSQSYLCRSHPAQLSRAGRNLSARKHHHRRAIRHQGNNRAHHYHHAAPPNPFHQRIDERMHRGQVR